MKRPHPDDKKSEDKNRNKSIIIFKKLKNQKGDIEKGFEMEVRKLTKKEMIEILRKNDIDIGGKFIVINIFIIIIPNIIMKKPTPILIP